MSVNLEDLRREFPITEDWAYLNHATHGPFPRGTAESISKLAHAWQNPANLDHSENDRTTDAVRRMIAGLVNGDPDRVAFTCSLAESMALAATGIDWADGDNCVIPEGEFPSVVYPFLNLEHRGVAVRFAPKGDDGHTSIDRMRETADARTRAVVLSHVEFRDGYRNDLSALAALCREMDALLIVDVTQALGPCRVDVESTGVDVIAAHSYKWLMASYGVGVTHFSERAMERIRPTYAGRLSVDRDFEDHGYELRWRKGADRYQTGGLNWITLTGLKASLELITALDITAIVQHGLDLTEQVMEGAAAKGYSVVSSREASHRSSIVAFTSGSPERDEEIVADLERQKVSVALRGRGVRVSPYFYNSPDEVGALIDALPALNGC